MPGRNYGDGCSFPDCPNRADGGEGLCAKHHARKKKYGDPGHLERAESDKLAKCTHDDGCDRPVCATGLCRMGGSTMIRVSTGEVVHSNSSANDPGGTVMVPCKNRRKSRCRACAEIYRSDAYQLLKAGLAGGKGVPGSVAGHPRVFVTFTAESFGPVHHRVLGKDGKTVLRCHPHGEHRCRKRHREDDKVLGEPLDPDSYDYVGVALWNARSTALWAKTMDLLTKELAARAGFSQRSFRLAGSRTHAKVAEAQTRGLIHFHAIIRLDRVDPDDPTAIVTPGDWASVELLEEAIRAVRARAMVKAPGGREIRWGPNLDVKPIASFAASQELTEEGVQGYLVKEACRRIADYSTKGAEWAGALDRPIWCRHCKGTGQVDGSEERTLDPETGEIGIFRYGEASGLPVASAERECDRCGGSGLRVSIASLKVSDHVRRMIQTCWDLGGDPAYGELNLRRWAHQFGYGGHFLSESRRYSTTLTALRQVRRDYCTSHTLARVGLDRATPVVRLVPGAGVESAEVPADVEDEVVVLVGSWRYHGRGHSPGERTWAESVAEGIAGNRRLAREAQMGFSRRARRRLGGRGMRVAALIAQTSQQGGLSGINVSTRSWPG